MQYGQEPISTSCDADMTLQLLQLHLQDFVKLLGVWGIKDTHMTFVDDLLLPKEHVLQTLAFGAESTFLGCVRCMAALLFFS